jgi:uncharacterized protein (TIGR03435 family)
VPNALAWALLAVLAPAASLAQAPPEPPAFEVASVKQNVATRVPGSTGLARSEEPGRIAYTGISLRLVLMRAYNVKGYQIVGPSWMDTERYDIVAKLPAGASKDQIPLMLQNLLVERFQMTVRRETRELPVYALVVGKNGPNLKKTDKPDDEISFSTGGHLEARSVASLVDMLSGFLDRPVLDMTGIEGNFEISLDVSMEDLIGLRGLRELMSTAGAQPGGAVPSGRNPAPEADPEASIFTAVQQLGLKLESRKAPMEMIVIDKAEKVPTEN